MTGQFVITVEDEEGGFLVEGPFDTEEAAQARANIYKASLRLAAYRAHPEDYTHPDDPPIFAWVVPIVPVGTAIDNPYGSDPVELIDSTMDLEV